MGYALRFPGPGPELRFDSSHTGPFNSTSLWWSVDSGPVHLVATAGLTQDVPRALKLQPSSPLFLLIHLHPLPADGNTCDG